LDKSKLSIGASVDTRKSKGSAEPPADELEEAILQIWQEVLEIDDAVGVTDSFFDLGGDSLLASMTVTKMRSRVKEAQAVDWNDLMNLLLKNNTVRKLAAALREGDSQDGPETPDYVTVYQKGADQPHKLWAFFVNGNATMTIYKTMLELLKSKISANDQVVGFHCGDPERFLALKTEDVIDCMARRNCAFLETQNAETHQLIGHCFGGAVAIETARLLQAHNVQNVRVTTIDSRRLRGRFDNPLFFEKAFGEMYGVDMSRCGYEIDDELHKGAMAEFLEKHGHFPTIEEACEASDLPKEVRDCYRALASKPVEERLQRIFAQLEGRLQDGLDKVYFMNSYRLFLKILSAFSLYDPIPYDGDVETYICRDLSGFFLPSDDVETMDYAKDALVKVGERLWVDGDHYSCLESPNVETIVERL
jgi:pyochelin synthetase